MKRIIPPKHTFSSVVEKLIRDLAAGALSLRHESSEELGSNSHPPADAKRLKDDGGARQ